MNNFCFAALAISGGVIAGVIVVAGVLISQWIENAREEKKQWKEKSRTRDSRKLGKKQMKKKNQWKLAAAALILTLACSSCMSTRQKRNEPIVYERPDVPDPYDQEGWPLVIYNEATDQVSTPLFFWKKLMRYVIDAESAFDTIDEQNK